MKRSVFVRLVALVFVATILVGCAVSLGLTNSPTIPNSVPDPLKKELMPETAFCYHCATHHPLEEMRQILTKTGKRWRCVKSIEATKIGITMRDAYPQSQPHPSIAGRRGHWGARQRDVNSLSYNNRCAKGKRNILGPENALSSI